MDHQNNTSYKDSGRRAFLVAATVLSVLIGATVLCGAVYVILIVPIRGYPAANATTLAENTQVALFLTQTRAAEDQATSTPVDTLGPTATPTLGGAPTANPGTATAQAQLFPDMEVAEEAELANTSDGFIKLNYPTDLWPGSQSEFIVTIGFLGTDSSDVFNKVAVSHRDDPRSMPRKEEETPIQVDNEMRVEIEFDDIIIKPTTPLIQEISETRPTTWVWLLTAPEDLEGQRVLVIYVYADEDSETYSWSGRYEIYIGNPTEVPSETLRPTDTPVPTVTTTPTITVTVTPTRSILQGIQATFEKQLVEDPPGFILKVAGWIGAVLVGSFTTIAVVIRNRLNRLRAELERTGSAPEREAIEKRIRRLEDHWALGFLKLIRDIRKALKGEAGDG